MSLISDRLEMMQPAAPVRPARPRSNPRSPDDVEIASQLRMVDSHPHRIRSGT